MNEEINIPFYNDLLFKCFVYNNEDQEHHELIREYVSLDKKYHDDKGSLYHVCYDFYI